MPRALDAESFSSRDIVPEPSLILKISLSSEGRPNFVTKSFKKKWKSWRHDRGAVRPWWRVTSNERNRNFIIITPACTVNKRWFWPCGRGWGSLQRERWLQWLSGKLPRILAWKILALRKMVTALAEQIRMDLRHIYLIKCRQAFWFAQRWVVHCILGTLPRQWQLPWGSYFFMPLFMNRLCLTSPERFLKTWYWL